MLFKDKLEFLLHLTATSNRQLASALMVDPSFISRLRCGKRMIPHNSTYANDIATFFSRKIITDYQKAALAEIIGQNRIKTITNQESLSLIILDWLMEVPSNNSKSITQFIHNLSEKQPINVDDYEISTMKKNDKYQSHAFYGNEGKREALRVFFSYLLSINKPCTILISTDEDLTWLNENPTFIIELQKHLVILADAGFSFCRISPRIFDSTDSIENLNRWLPIYMRGKIESYYYPRMRDNLYRRTLIVAPNLAAICSSSINGQMKSDITFLNIDVEMANAAAREFNDYLSKCNRMCIIHQHSEVDDPIKNCLERFLQTPGNRLGKHTYLPTYALPDSILKKVFNNNLQVLNLISYLCKLNEENLSKYEQTDIIFIPPIEDIKKGLISCAVNKIIDQGGSFFYTSSLFVEHLNNVIRLLETYPKYNVCISSDITNKNIICVIENTLCYIIRVSTPTTIFEISESYFLTSINEYLLNIANDPYNKQPREKLKTINTLKNIVKELTV